MVIISLSLAIAPALLLVWYYYKQDKEKPEPAGLIIKVFLFGVLSIIPTIFIELGVEAVGKALALNQLLAAFFKAFFVAALCEEWIKLMVVKLVVFKRSEFDEVMDGIVYTVVASLGFACFENVMYVMGGGISVAILRAFTSIPLHAIASGIMGYYIGRSKFDPNNSGTLTVIGLLIAIAIHGVYDFVLFAIPDLGYLPVLLIIPILIGGFFFLKSKIKEAIEMDKKAGRVGTPVEPQQNIMQ